MSEIAEIKNRIRGVSETQKITNALYLISSAKSKAARRELSQTAPFFEAIREEVKAVFKTVRHFDSKYFYPENDHMSDSDYGYLVITADKGMAGAYNQNMIKMVERELSIHDRSRLFVVGDFGYKYFSEKGAPLAKDFVFHALHPTLSTARTITDLLLERYLRGEFSKLFIVYTDISDGAVVVRSTRILPFHTAEFLTDPEPQTDLYEFVPSGELVLERIAPSYVCGYVYSALVDSYCAEQNARLVAMKSANDNATELMNALRRDYDHARQNEITTEITEIASGAKYQRSKSL